MILPDRIDVIPRIPRQRIPTNTSSRSVGDTTPTRLSPKGQIQRYYFTVVLPASNFLYLGQLVTLAGGDFRLWHLCLVRVGSNFSQRLVHMEGNENIERQDVCLWCCHFADGMKKSGLIKPRYRPISYSAQSASVRCSLFNPGGHFSKYDCTALYLSRQ